MKNNISKNYLNLKNITNHHYNCKKCASRKSSTEKLYLKEGQEKYKAYFILVKVRVVLKRKMPYKGKNSNVLVK